MRRPPARCLRVKSGEALPAPWRRPRKLGPSKRFRRRLFTLFEIETYGLSNFRIKPDKALKKRGPKPNMTAHTNPNWMHTKTPEREVIVVDISDIAKNSRQSSNKVVMPRPNRSTSIRYRSLKRALVPIIQMSRRDCTTWRRSTAIKAATPKPNRSTGGRCRSVRDPSALIISK
jgi:hypothetical protein